LFDFSIVRRYIDCHCVANLAKIFSDNVTPDELFNDYKLISYDYSLESGVYVKTKILELINQGRDVLIFPEGFQVRQSSRNECLLKEFKRGLFYLAYENNISIIPISQWHYNNNDISYFDTYLINIMSNLPIENMNVDVIIEKEIKPCEFKAFDDFYRTCFQIIYDNLIKLKNK